MQETKQILKTIDKTNQVFWTRCAAQQVYYKNYGEKNKWEKKRWLRDTKLKNIKKLFSPARFEAMKKLIEKEKIGCSDKMKR